MLLRSTDSFSFTPYVVRPTSCIAKLIGGHREILAVLQGGLRQPEQKQRAFLLHKIDANPAFSTQVPRGGKIELKVGLLREKRKLPSVVRSHDRSQFRTELPRIQSATKPSFHLENPNAAEPQPMWGHVCNVPSRPSRCKRAPTTKFTEHHASKVLYTILQYRAEVSWKFLPIRLFTAWHHRPDGRVPPPSVAAAPPE